jgi:hypothetical protein
MGRRTRGSDRQPVLPLLLTEQARREARSFVVIAFLTLVAAQLFDFATFFVMVRHEGLGTEANPIVANLFLGLGTPAVLVSKLLLIMLVASVAAAGRTRPRTWRSRFMATAPVALAIAAGLVGGISNARVIMA